MKYFHLIWAELMRRKTRTALTLLSIVAAFLLFGLLDGVRESFDQAGNSANGAKRLQTGSRLSFIQPLPMSLNDRIAQVQGVKQVSYANWFGGAYQDPHNQIFSFAVASNYLDLYPEIQVDKAQRKAFDETRTGVLVGAQLMQRFGWKVGQKLPLQSTIFPNSDGSKNWNFDIVGTIAAADKKTGGWYDQMVLLHWKYFDDSNPYNRGQVGWYITEVGDVNQADRVAKAIDAISANSDHESKTQTEAASAANWMKQMADIGLIVGSIMGAVFFTLVLLTGNTMAQAVRERTSELAVLKTIGFPDRSVLMLVLAESVLLLLIGGVVGVALARLMGPIVSAGSRGAINIPPISGHSWALALGLMVAIGLVVGALPAIRAMRLNIVDALAGR
ncbi:ABC transporter permease [Lysobacter enzymogenes]|uniref:Efflux ABC transporter, permease protein n=1 Tax=Lysobacter enzymogenes TaxID=69 RepID=A0A0S2DN43_LYSEN|nr:FtsX-like permease family protein [Lysobacter enzymogenes]ALN59805.1 efflux ABC transporter, permease protein [Lysobacter enzymogenes]QCW27885.1 FtsX-like permease family protein [Lysobacter enzymogenes]QQQ02153.1 ABC transporter permease [Lysobacter enzymogenes]